MTNVWKRILVGAAVIGGVAAVGFFLMPQSASAAGRGNGYGAGNGARMHQGMMGGGMMGGMRGGMNGGMMAMMPAMLEIHQNELAAVAELLGMTSEDLTTALQDGTDVLDLAAEKNVDAAKITEAQVAARKAGLDELVADGTLTQEQADLMLEHMAQVGTATLNAGAGMMGQGMGAGAGHCPMAQSQTNNN
ncbi:MAG TPA: hypothetical protein VD973_05895 [Symbiobacteriaceae bacterium]|jgi:hypothetical protein|nr:hypothetical protein [Symbiobacteriaceae bacterium]